MRPEIVLFWTPNGAILRIYGTLTIVLPSPTDNIAGISLCHVACALAGKREGGVPSHS